MKVVWIARIEGLHGCELTGEIEVADTLKPWEVTQAVRLLAGAQLTIMWTDMATANSVMTGPEDPEDQTQTGM